MATEACQELTEFHRKALLSNQAIGHALTTALSPGQPMRQPHTCNVVGGEAFLKVIGARINGMYVNLEQYPFLTVLAYPNGCYLKFIVEQAGLAHLIPFSNTDSTPVPPLVRAQ